MSATMSDVKLCIHLLVIICFTYDSVGIVLERLIIIPERAEITYSNNKYVVNNTVNIRRYSRRSGYVVNFWGTIKHTWGNNVTVDVIFYEYLHNEYKRSFVEMHFKLCDLVLKDEYVGYPLRQVGLTCPMAKGWAGVKNLTMGVAKFPYVMPFGKFKAEVIFKVEPSHELIGTGDLFMHAKQDTLLKKAKLI